MDLLIQYLNEHAETFPEWKDSDQKQKLLELQVNLSDFNRWVGVSMAGGEYFMMCAGWIIREVWLDCVCSRLASPEKTDTIARAVCYEVIGRATQRLAYSALPEPIRIDINNEMGKNHRAAADQYIRDFVANQFIAKAQTYWNAVDLEIKKQAIEQEKKNASDQPRLGPYTHRESDPFFFT
jgi:hypothetical protein